MDEPDPFAGLEDVIGYRFRDRTLLEQALTHSSRKPELRCSNERLEFLGDAVLGAAISDFLYRRFPQYNEGDLTRLKSVVVSRTSLARAAREMRLGTYLLVAKGVANLAPEAPGDFPGEADTASDEPASGRKACPPGRTLPPSILADAFEALLAAVYLDAGAAVAYDFVLRRLGAQLDRATEELPAHNAKSMLQEFVQRRMNATPVYKVTAETGPDHVKMFEVLTIIAGQPYAAGRGATKKAAEQMAAELTLSMLGKNGSNDEGK